MIITVDIPNILDSELAKACANNGYVRKVEETDSAFLSRAMKTYCRDMLIGLRRKEQAKTVVNVVGLP